MNANAIKEGATVIAAYTVVKVNSKSVILEDSRGNRVNVRDRDYKYYSINPGKGNNITSTRKSNVIKSEKESITTTKAVGRMPTWATTKDKKKFVIMSRQAGNKATLALYKEFKKSK